MKVRRKLYSNRGRKHDEEVKKGAMADIVVLHTETLQVEATIREGNLIYARADQQ